MLCVTQDGAKGDLPTQQNFNLPAPRILIHLRLSKQMMKKAVLSGFQRGPPP